MEGGRQVKSTPDTVLVILEKRRTVKSRHCSALVSIHCAVSSPERSLPTRIYSTTAKTFCRFEIQALLDFLSAAVDMQHWHFFPALMKLARWGLFEVVTVE